MESYVCGYQIYKDEKEAKEKTLQKFILNSILFYNIQYIGNYIEKIKKKKNGDIEHIFIKYYTISGIDKIFKRTHKYLIKSL